jgi:hypothetical protein
MDDLIHLGAHFLTIVAILAAIALVITFTIRRRDRAKRAASKINPDAN